MNRDDNLPDKPGIILDYRGSSPGEKKPGFWLSFICGFVLAPASFIIGVVLTMRVGDWAGMLLILGLPASVVLWGIIDCVRRRSAGVLVGALIAIGLLGFLVVKVCGPIGGMGGMR